MKAGLLSAPADPTFRPGVGPRQRTRAAAKKGRRQARRPLPSLVRCRPTARDRQARRAPAGNGAGGRRGGLARGASRGARSTGAAALPLRRCWRVTARRQSSTLSASSASSSTRRRRLAVRSRCRSLRGGGGRVSRYRQRPSTCRHTPFFVRSGRDTARRAYSRAGRERKG